jgi:hypothetical protein
MSPILNLEFMVFAVVVVNLYFIYEIDQTYFQIFFRGLDIETILGIRKKTTKF